MKNIIHSDCFIPLIIVPYSPPPHENKQTNSLNGANSLTYWGRASRKTFNLACCIKIPVTFEMTQSQYIIVLSITKLREDTNEKVFFFWGGGSNH